MNQRVCNNGYKYNLHKLLVSKGHKNQKSEFSKRNSSNIKKQGDNLSIYNDKNRVYIPKKVNVNKVFNNSLLKDQKIKHDLSKDSKKSKRANKIKLLSLASNQKDLNNINNYYTNEDKKNKDDNEETEKTNNSFVEIKSNDNLQKKSNTIENTNEEKEHNENIKEANDANDNKYNITVNKVTINDNDNNNNHYNNISIKEQNKNRVLKQNKRDLSAKLRKDVFIFNKYLKDKSNSNYSQKNTSHSPLVEPKEIKFSAQKTPNLINNLKKKNNISNINTISFIKNNITNYNSNASNQRISTNEEYFDYSFDKSQELTKDEKIIYGDRMMKGYIKKKLLGKGGCGIVWLATKSDNNNLIYSKNEEYYAVKQTSKKNGNGVMNKASDNVITAKNEIRILCKLNNKESEKENENCENNNFIPNIYEHYEDSNDIWFSFEKGGISISGLSFKIKGEFEKGERIYFVQKGKFLINLFSNIHQFKYLIKSLILGIDYINQKGIIHSDIKPENILIEYEGNSPDNFNITSIKIIDYGSAIILNNNSVISSNTPEYLCPEVTIGNKKFMKDLKKANSQYINCIDIWSLGITILELCLCCPIWMNYKTKVLINGKIHYKNGIFGCRGRDGSKIYQKQVDLVKSLNKKLKNSMIYLFEQKDKDNFLDLLKQILEIDYKKRITCQDALKHDFFKE